MKPASNIAFRFSPLSFLLLLGTLLMPALANAQITFPKSGYYVALGDSISAGEGAMPATQGAVYRLYDQGTFGMKQAMDFSNIAIRGARTYELLNYQVPETICLTNLPPTVITITVGGNDIITGDFDVAGIAARSAEIVNRLLNGFSSGGIACPAPPNVTVLIANNYAPPVPDPTLNAQLDFLASTYDQLLRADLSSVHVPAGSRVGYVDLYTAFKGRNGLLLVQKKNGITGPGPFDFNVHPTNAGHAVIADTFQNVWIGLQH
jgi:lysophospholipase L1-like esterase